MQKKKEKRKEKTEKIRFARMTNYPIGDFLIRLKNLAKSGKKNMEAPKTNLIEAVALCLKRLGYLNEVEKEGNFLKIKLAQVKKESVVEDIVIVSRPGLRVYMSREELEKFRSPAILVLSTPKGILSDKEAVKKGIGGEVIAKVY